MTTWTGDELNKIGGDSEAARVMEPLGFEAAGRRLSYAWTLAADPIAACVVEAVIQRLSPWARLHAVEGGDHSFRVPGTKRPDRGVGHDLAQVAAEFIRGSIVA